MNDKSKNLEKEIETYKRDNSKLLNQWDLYSDYYSKIKAELEKWMMSLQCKTTECQEWNKKYEESDEQLASLEKSMEKMQEESYGQVQQLHSNKDEEIKELRANMKNQFEEEMRQYVESMKTLQTNLVNSKSQNKEIANEMVKATNENSSLILRIKQLETESKEFKKVKAELAGLHKAQDNYVPKEELEKANESENYLRSRISQLDQQLKSYTAQNSLLESEISDINNGKIRTKQVEELQELLEKRQSDIMSYAKENEKLKKEFFSNQSRITKTEQKLDSSKNDNRELNQNYKNVITEYKDLEKKSKELEKKYKRKKEENNKYAGDWDRFFTTITGIEEKLEESKKMVEKVKKERDNAKQELKNVRVRYRTIIGVDEDNE